MPPPEFGREEILRTRHPKRSVARPVATPTELHKMPVSFLISVGTYLSKERLRQDRQNDQDKNHSILNILAILI